MDLRSITIDLKHANCPMVTVQVVVDGEVSPPLVARDDEAKAICEMVPNPNGDGVVASGKFSLDAAIAFADARLSENANPKDFADLHRSAEAAREYVAEAEVAKVALAAEAEEKQRLIASLATEAEAKAAEIARLDAELEAKRSPEG